MVLIIVVGLSMVLLGIAISFMVRMRSDSRDTRIVLDEAQARLVLHGALMYLQESSRLGWGTETFGWTDVRDGSLGPRGARDFSPSGSGAAIPTPMWWTAGAYDAVNPTLPADNLRRWPYPGSVLRCPLAVPVQPPYATQLRHAYNPVGIPPGAPRYGEAGFETPWITAATGVDPVLRTSANATLPTSVYWPIGWMDQIFDPDQGAMAALDPQPEADVWSDPSYTGAPGQRPDFISGAIQAGVVVGDWTHVVDDGTTQRPVQLAVKPGTENVCWFRIYRETQQDHDGDGTPRYDRVVMYDAQYPQLKNWSVFVIACGVGGTRGYRFWDATDADRWATLNGVPTAQVTRGQEYAADSGLFASQAQFAAARESTRVAWWRVEWSSLQGGGFVPENYSYTGARIYARKSYTLAAAPPAAPGTLTDFSKPRVYPGWSTTRNSRPDEANSDFFTGVSDGNYSDGLRYTAPKTFGGNFRWVQRLDHEPTNW